MREADTFRLGSQFWKVLLNIQYSKQRNTSHCLEDTIEHSSTNNIGKAVNLITKCTVEINSTQIIERHIKKILYKFQEIDQFQNGYSRLKSLVTLLGT